MADEEFLDLSREEVLTSTNDHVFEPTHDVDVALCIHCRQVTCVEPSLLVNGRGSLLWHLVVALHHEVTSTAQLATLPTRQYVTCGRMNNLDLGMGQRDAHSGGFQDKRITRQGLRNYGTGFGLPKDDTHVCSHALFDLLHQVDWHRSATSTDTRERCEIIPRDFGLLQHGHHHLTNPY